MKYKHFLFHSAARAKVLHGADILADALRVTLGPKMHTIAKKIELKVAVENVGAQIMRKRPERTGPAIGDGITTATILAHALLAEGIRNIDAGASAIDLKKGVNCGLRARRNTRSSPCVLTEEHAGRLSVQRPALSLFGVRT